MVALHIDALMVYGHKVSPATPAGNRVREAWLKEVTDVLVLCHPSALCEGTGIPQNPVLWIRQGPYLKMNQLEEY